MPMLASVSDVLLEGVELVTASGLLCAGNEMCLLVQGLTATFAKFEWQTVESHSDAFSFSGVVGVETHPPTQDIGSKE